MEPEVLKILEDIRQSQNRSALALEIIKGDIKLQSQALQHHITNLKEFKADTRKDFDELENRIDKLEKWQARIAGIVAVVTAGAVLIFDNIREALFTR